MNINNRIMNLVQKFYKQKPWNRAVTTIAAVIIFVTTYMLILPAITMTVDPVCGLEEHIHGPECYTMVEHRELVCPYADSPLTIVHRHDESCYKDGVLVCPLKEVEAHTHTAECYGGVLPANAAGTALDPLSTGGAAVPAGQTSGTDAAAGNAASLTESFGSVQGAALNVGDSSALSETPLFGDGNPAAAVLEEEPLPPCGKKEVILHTHEAGCYDELGQLICTRPEVIEHQHTDTCFLITYEEVLTCSLPEHQHTDECYEKQENTGLLPRDEVALPEEASLTQSEIEGSGAEQTVPREELAGWETDPYAAEWENAVPVENGAAASSPDLDPNQPLVGEDQGVSFYILPQDSGTEGSETAYPDETQPVEILEADGEGQPAGEPSVVEQPGAEGESAAPENPEILEDIAPEILEEGSPEEIQTEKAESEIFIEELTESAAQPEQEPADLPQEESALFGEKAEDADETQTEATGEGTNPREDQTTQEDRIADEDIITITEEAPLIEENHPDEEKPLDSEEAAVSVTESVIEQTTELTTESSASMEQEADQPSGQESGEAASDLPEEMEEQAADTTEDGEAVTEPGVEQITESAAEQTTDAALAVSVDQRPQSVTEQAPVQVTESASEETTDALKEDSVGRTTEPAAETMTQRLEEGIAEQTTESIAESAVEQTTETIVDGATEQTTEQLAEGATEQTTEWLAEDITEQTTEWLNEGTAEQTTEWLSEGVTEQTTEWLTEGTTELTTQEWTTEGETEQTTEMVNESTTVVLEYEGPDYKVRLTCFPSSGIPQGAHVEAQEILPGDEEGLYETYLAESKKALGLDENTTLPKKYARFFDIQILDQDGNEIEPTGPVKVEILYDEPVEGVGEDSPSANVLHFDDESKAAQVLTPRNPEENAQSNNKVEEVAEAASSVTNIEDSVSGGEAMTAERNDGEGSTENANSPEPLQEDGSSGQESSTGSGQEDIAEGDSEEVSVAEFSTDGFSVYGVVYTVDFYWEVDGKEFEFSIPGGGFIRLSTLLEILNIAEDKASATDENEEVITGDEVTEDGELDLNAVVVSDYTRRLLENIDTVNFSDPRLVWVGKVEKTVTVGNIKYEHELACRYSESLSRNEINEINESVVSAGDWALISLYPFNTEESLTVKLKTGEEFVIRVTDANITNREGIRDSGYVIYAKADNGKYYVLNASGGTEEFQADTDTEFYVKLDHLGPQYKWKFTYVYEEDGIYRYNIRPSTDKTVSLSLNYAGHPLVENGANNITVVEDPDGGYRFGGYHNTALQLVQDGSTYKFRGVNDKDDDNDPVGDEFTPVYIYDVEALHTHEFTVITDNSDKGRVTGTNKDNESVNKAVSYTDVTKYYADTTLPKTNKNQIKAEADTTIVGADNTGYKYIFDHWELDGKILYQTNQNSITTNETDAKHVTQGETTVPVTWGATIGAGKLVIPENGSVLKAFFTENPSYKPQDADMKGTSLKDMDAWLSAFMSQNTPIKEGVSKKTAEVYDYENRIYRIDLTTQSNLRTFDGNIDLGFVLDVSNSMLFPSKLVSIEYSDQLLELRKINSSNETTNSTYHQFDNINRKDYYWETWGLDPSKTYYVISDDTDTSTVFKLFYKSNYVGSDGSQHTGWFAIDASRGLNDKNSNNNNRYYREYITTSTTLLNKESDKRDNYWYKIYTPGLYNDSANTDIRTRMQDLQASMSSTISSLQEILEMVKIVDERKALSGTVTANATDPDVKIAWEIFNKNAPAKDANGNPITTGNTFTSASNYNVTFRYDNGGGTNTLDAINYAVDTFSSWSGNNRYLVLITDGAPQGGSNIVTEIQPILNSAKPNLAGKNIGMVTVGLGIENVTKGRQLLYQLADDVNGEHAFYSATSGDQLGDILLHILELILVKATVIGDITDTIGEAFYPVDLNTGQPLKNGDEIDIKGNLVPNNLGTSAAGKIVEENGVYKVEWNHQDIPYEGNWHGIVYVKAKEDFLGGTAVVTNNDEISKATVTATHYKTSGTTEYPLTEKAYYYTGKDANGNWITAENTNYNLKDSMATPKVNVNELHLSEKDTEWTVYLGTEVDPLKQLKELYNHIEVEEVVVKGAAGNDTLPSQLLLGKNSEDYNFAFIESILDRREQISGNPETFLIKDLIESLVDRSGTYLSADWWDYAKSDIRWDKIFEEAQKEDNANKGIIIPYNVYGTKDGANITIKLTKVIDENEEVDFTGNTLPEHQTTTTGSGVEKYLLSVKFNPDYTTVPEGQGGVVSNTVFHTGGFGTAYPGHAPGTEESTNNHKINVYEKTLEVQKKDELDQPLKNAEFTIFERVTETSDSAGTEETADTENTDTSENPQNTGESPSGNAENVSLTDFGLEGNYRAIAVGTSNNEGKVTFNSEFTLDEGTAYYLVETNVPLGYQQDKSYRIIRLEASDNGVYTDPFNNNAILPDKEYPFDWSQGMKLWVDDELADSFEADNPTELVDDWTRLSANVIFRTSVLNEKKTTNLTVTKNWKNRAGVTLSEGLNSVSFQVTMGEGEDTSVVSLRSGNIVPVDGVSLNDNIVTLTYNNGWPTARIVKLPYYVEEGSATKAIYNIKEVDHKPQDTEIEKIEYKRIVVDDQNIDFTIENTKKEEKISIGAEKVWLDAHGNPWTTPDLQQIEFVLYRVHYIPCIHQWETITDTPATCLENGELTRKCSICEEEETTTRIKLGHDWGDWEIDNQNPNRYEDGVWYIHRKRVCKRDDSHVEDKWIPVSEDHTCEAGEWEVTEKPSCGHPGEEARYCTICLRLMETRQIPALEHNYVEQEIVQSTCKVQGHVTKVCSNCGDEISEELPLLDHLWGDTWTVSRPATTTQEGEEERFCLRGCGERETRPIAMLPSNVKINFNFFKLINGDRFGAPSSIGEQEIENGSTVHFEFRTYESRGLFTGTYYGGYTSNYYPSGVEYKVNATINSQNDWGYTTYTVQGVGIPMDVDPTGEYVEWSLDYTVTEDTTISICLPSSWGNGILYTIDVTPPSRNMQTNAKKMLKSASAKLLKNTEPVRNTPVPAVLAAPYSGKTLMSAEEYASLPEIPAKDRVKVYVYEVVEDTRTIKASDEWKWDSGELERSDANGNEYAYYVMETNPASGYITTYTGQDNGLHDKDKATIKNQQNRGGLKITKNVTVDGLGTAGTLADGTYTFTVTKKDDVSFSQTVTVTITNGVSQTEEVKVDGKADNLLPGTYVVTETSSTNSGTSVSRINGEITSENSVEVEVEAGKIGETAVTTVFTNDYPTTAIKIFKIDSESDKNIGGAKFTLTKDGHAVDLNQLVIWNLDEEGNPTETAGTISTLEEVSSSVSVLEVPENGVIIQGLTNGKYEIVEKQAPDGYVITKMETEIEVSKGVVNGLDKNVISISNTPGAALPATGGSGTIIFYSLGALLTILSTVMLTVKRRAA